MCIFVCTLYGGALDLIDMRQVVSHARADRAQTFYRKIIVELSTMDFEGLMAFVGGELEMAA